MEKVLSKWRQSLLSLLLFAVQLFQIRAFRETLSPQVCKGGAQGAWASPLFLTKLKPEGPKKNFVETSPPPPSLSRIWMTRHSPSFLWRSGSTTVLLSTSSHWPYSSPRGFPWCKKVIYIFIVYNSSMNKNNSAVLICNKNLWYCRRSQ